MESHTPPVRLTSRGPRFTEGPLANLPMTRITLADLAPHNKAFQRLGSKPGDLLSGDHRLLINEVVTQIEDQSEPRRRIRPAFYYVRSEGLERAPSFQGVVIVAQRQVVLSLVTSYDSRTGIVGADWIPDSFTTVQQIQAPAATAPAVV